MIIKLVSVIFTLLITYALSGFSNAVDPEYFDVATILIFFIMAGASQSGLWLSSTKIGKRFRWATAAFMIPSALLLIASNYEAIERYISGRPLDLAVNITYLLGVLVYFFAYFHLFKGKQNGI